MIGKLAVAFLGVRGMGSIYYLAYGQNNADFAQIDLLWATVSFAILVSIIVHGVVSGPLIRHVEDRRAHVHAGQDTSMAALSPDADREAALEGGLKRRGTAPQTTRGGEPDPPPLIMIRCHLRGLTSWARPSWQQASWLPASSP